MPPPRERSEDAQRVPPPREPQEPQGEERVVEDEYGVVDHLRAAHGKMHAVVRVVMWLLAIVAIMIVLGLIFDPARNSPDQALREENERLRSQIQNVQQSQSGPAGGSGEGVRIEVESSDPSNVEVRSRTPRENSE